jgi:class 3 adenylate cyclase
MVTERSAPLPLEIAYVLFMDIVTYSKLPVDHQRRAVKQLQKAVSSSHEFVRAKAQSQLLSLHTGDGMALVFFTDAEAPARCALEISRSLRGESYLPLRMGLHVGPVYRIADINANSTVAGSGINLAQRVMDCGDAGHILVSKALAEILTQVSTWEGTLTDLGEVEVKHGVRVHLFNLKVADAGNTEPPKKLSKPVPAQNAPDEMIRCHPLKFSLERPFPIIELWTKSAREGWVSYIALTICNSIGMSP